MFVLGIIPTIRSRVRVFLGGFQLTSIHALTPLHANERERERERERDSLLTRLYSRCFQLLQISQERSVAVSWTTRSRSVGTEEIEHTRRQFAFRGRDENARDDPPLIRPLSQKHTLPCKSPRPIISLATRAVYLWWSRGVATPLNRTGCYTATQTTYTVMP
jgi:hypothetical protein